MALSQHLVKAPLLRWMNAVDGTRYVKRHSLLRRFRPRVTASLAFRDGLFEVSDSDGTVFVARKSRVHQNLTGIARRRASLRRQYLVPESFIRPGDVVIDCGANIGEFSMICAEEGATVFAFEPDPTEFAALQRNAHGRDITPFNVALWNEDTEMTFYDSNDEGDSSLIDPGDAARTITVQARRLETMAELPERRIRLIKLEAEGAEPEILSGMGDILSRVDYICADMGPERGVSKETTLPQVTDTLYALGFRMEAFYPPRCTGLFHKPE